ncbi:MAG: rRNA maturation RNase YbeY [bacterium]|nr:rRNA maturation RNase YbeY [bacterium]
MIPRLIDRRTQTPADDLVTDQMGLYQKLVSGMGNGEWNFNLVLVDDDNMKSLNEEFRGKQTVTDVLSFSYLLSESGEGSHLPQGINHAYVDLWMDGIAGSADALNDSEIGEIILAPNFIFQRCAERSWKPETELPMLVVHGCLHLLGWDHETVEQTLAMRKEETEILGSCHLKHPLNEGGI